MDATRGRRLAMWLSRDWGPTGYQTMRAAGLLVLIALYLGCAPAARPQERIDLPSRPGVTQPIYLTAARNPVASAILFPGSSGVVSTERMDTEFRAGEAQAADTASIVAFLRSRAAVPVWLVGTSRGSIAAANAAVRLGTPRIAGVVLTSSVWIGGMSAVPISTLRVPVMIVHNRNDSCGVSPYAQAEQAFATLRAAPARQFLAVAGGSSRGNPCGAMSPHGYLGIEDQELPPIVAWIRTH